MSASRETATLAGGCFWCLEAVFQPLKGVERVVSGYTGGVVGRPTYEDVCTGTTGHAEAVQVTFDPSVLSCHDLLELFFAFHDPTTRNRQGGDVGPQYRSSVFYHDAEQERIARDLIADLERERVFPDPIVTELVPLREWYPAEEYHQGYYARNPDRMYCQAVIAPKVAKLRRKYTDLIRA